MTRKAFGDGQMATRTQTSTGNNHAHRWVVFQHELLEDSRQPLLCIVESCVRAIEAIDDAIDGLDGLFGCEANRLPSRRKLRDFTRQQMEFGG